MVGLVLRIFVLSPSLPFHSLGLAPRRHVLYSDSAHGRPVCTKSMLLEAGLELHLVMFRAELTFVVFPIVLFLLTP